MLINRNVASTLLALLAMLLLLCGGTSSRAAFSRLDTQPGGFAIQGATAAPGEVLQITVSGPIAVAKQEKLRLYANVSVVRDGVAIPVTPANTHCVWTEIKQNLQLAPLLLTPPDSPAFTLVENCLTPGLQYEFRLDVTDLVSGLTGAVAVFVSVSLPPSGGTCTAAPTSGSGAPYSPAYTISCSGWQAPTQQFPLYAFQFTYNSVPQGFPYTTTTPIALAAQSQTSKCTVPLPFGELTVSAFITDPITKATAQYDVPLVVPRGSQTDAQLVAQLETTLIPAATGASQLLLIQYLSDLLNASPQLSANVNVPQLINNVVSVANSGGSSAQVVAALAPLTAASATSTTGSSSTTVLDTVSQAVSSGQPLTPTALQQSADVLSNMLADNATSCDVIKSAAFAAARQNLLEAFIAGALPSEQATQAKTSFATFAAARVFSSKGARAPVASTNVVLPPDALNGWHSDVLLVQYAAELRACLLAETTAPSPSNPSQTTTTQVKAVADIIDVTVMNADGRISGINAVQNGVSFQMTYDPKSVLGFDNSEACRCQHNCWFTFETPYCAWYNHATSSWDKTGCTSTPGSDANTIQCSCSHTTEFSIVLGQAEAQDPSTDPSCPQSNNGGGGGGTNSGTSTGSSGSGSTTNNGSGSGSGSAGSDTGSGSGSGGSGSDGGNGGGGSNSGGNDNSSGGGGNVVIIGSSGGDGGDSTSQQGGSGALPHLNLGQLEQQRSATVYLVFAAIYGVLGVAALAQVCNVARYSAARRRSSAMFGGGNRASIVDRGSMSSGSNSSTSTRVIECACLRGCHPSPSLVQHMLLLAVAVFRVFSCLYFAGDLNGAPLEVAGLLAALPYAVLFWVYTLVVFQWASVYHTAMKVGSKFEKVKPAFLACNLIMSLCVIALFLSLTSVGNNTARVAIAQVGVSVMAAVSIITALAFVVYATHLSRALTAPEDSAHNLPLVRRMLAVAAVVSLSFTVESVFWLLSIFDEGSYTDFSAAYTAIFLAFDCLSFLAMLRLFKGSVDKLKPQVDPNQAEDTSSDNVDSSDASHASKKRGSSSAGQKGKRGSSSASGNGNNKRPSAGVAGPNGKKRESFRDQRRSAIVVAPVGQTSPPRVDLGAVMAAVNDAPLEEVDLHDDDSPSMSMHGRDSISSVHGRDSVSEIRSASVTAPHTSVAALNSTQWNAYGRQARTLSQSMDSQPGHVRANRAASAAAAARADEQV